jgi:tetratricopeptide (TPR) repeat protein
MGEFEKALEIFQKAEALRREKGSVPQIRVARWCVARTLRSLNRLEEALAQQMELKAEIESSGDTEDGYVYEEIGECLLLLKRAEESRPYFAMAHVSLSRDSWLAAHEPERLKRLQLLGSTD